MNFKLLFWLTTLFAVIMLLFKYLKLGLIKVFSKNITPNFKWGEFISKDGVAIPESLKPNVIEVCKNLEIIRKEVGNKPIKVHSGFRSFKHNAEVGGRMNSYHLQGKAADISVKGMTSKELYDTIIRLMDEGKIKAGGVGLYATFVHYDIRGSKVTFKG
ncbi:Peptidase M15 family protein (modular protein) [Capnocytophaga canimorsus]|uniref:Peptidase M15 family protein (Modular protein) n=1 Tax=Capnocytophaga canimorsus TaxID=28188 RepID=A0A0B7H3G3_9FLAO|nr:peptidase M15-like protein [Capnocytophaga canimorsus]CEN34126.1 Peptidase M15 family protein (modular protein) [Capnocytophaga canimorsus]STA71501.1 Zinc D-Ala-D-Ala carboxypeptidase precursor [Capnocytophaga canimorsus]